MVTYVEAIRCTGKICYVRLKSGVSFTEKLMGVEIEDGNEWVIFEERGRVNVKDILTIKEQQSYPSLPQPEKKVHIPPAELMSSSSDGA